jgi:hypothetical protein
MNVIILVLQLIFGSFSADNVQLSADPPVSVLNEYVDLTNESIHGLLIIHRLLENYNQKLNKQITGGTPINLYNNADLPTDIFKDPEGWFFLKNPYKIVEGLEQHAKTNPKDRSNLLLPSARRMLKICNAINTSRFAIEQYLQKNDMQDSVHQKVIFEKLESCVDMYKDFYNTSSKLESDVLAMYTPSDYKKRSYFYQIFQAHTLVKDILRTLRTKSETNIDSGLSALKVLIAKIESANDESGPLQGSLGTIHSNVIIKIIEAHDNAYLFANTAVVPIEYQLYDKYYYYHNSQIINKMNRYGNGYAREVNLLMDQLKVDELKLFEEPHFFQVAYPKEEKPEADVITSEENVVENLPEQLLNRSVTSSEHLIHVDSMTFTINLYDYKLTDGDIVSINFNGDWILKEYSLEEKPVKLRIKLNANGKNFLLLHAESIGRRPPNTMGLSYYFKGEKKEMILKSDLKASEMIEIEYVDPNRS